MIPWMELGLTPDARKIAQELSVEYYTIGRRVVFQHQIDGWPEEVFEEFIARGMVRKAHGTHWLTDPGFNDELQAELIDIQALQSREITEIYETTRADMKSSIDAGWEWSANET